MMNTYDILVNYKRYLYDFYEWDKDDEIKHIKKIPTYKVESKVLYDFMNNDVIVDSEFLNEIENKTELYTNKYNKLINYACILFCKYEGISFLFDDKGNIIGRSKLLYDECDDVLVSGKNLDVYKINYKKQGELESKEGFTKREIKIINILSLYIQNLYDNKKEDELKFLYYDCYDEEPKNYIDYLKIKNSILNGDTEIINKLLAVKKVLNN